MCLQQKHVVAVKMRPHTAAVARIADHQIVQAGRRNKGKALQQLMRRSIVQIDPLHQQGPVLGLERGDRAAAERAVLDAPGAALLLDQARFHALLPCQFKQLCTRQWQLQIFPVGHGAAHQKRLLLPVTAHELGWRESAEQRQCLFDLHGFPGIAMAPDGQTATIVLWKSLINAWSR
ncbi:hypothetical protein D3C72_1597520 [compost metagenome]